MAKTKALISYAVTAKLICVFVFAYAKIRFSHDEVHLFFCHCVSFSRFADGRYKPQLDTALNGENNVFNVSGYMTEDTAVVSFLRFISSEENRDVSLESDRYLIFARGRLGNNRDITFHSFRAVSENQFIFSCGEFMYFFLPVANMPL